MFRKLAWVALGFIMILDVVGASKPNIIFIMVDDLGKEWIASYGGDGIATPNIDAMAAGGMKFNHAWSMPKCTPTRVTLLTGQYPFRHGWIDHWDVPRWSPEEAKGGGAYFDWRYHITFARVLKAAGYSTAAAGKWQINDFRVQPDAMVKHGFDEYSMWTGGESNNPASNNRYWDPYIHYQGESKTYEGEYGPDIFLEFIQDFIARKKDGPFAIYYPMALTHTPFVSTPHKPDVTEKMDKHVAMVEYTDYIVGEIRKTLEEHKVDSNTIVIFTTDNGTVGSITGSIQGTTVKGGKGQRGQNGMCEPFIVYGPGLVPAGKENDVITDFTDMLPTFAELAGISLDSLNDYYTLDGVSIADVILGEAENTTREWALSMGGGVSVLGDSGVTGPSPYKERALSNGTFKVWVDKNGEIEKIYNLQTDPFEKNDLLGSSDAAVLAALEYFEGIIDGLPARDARFVYDGAVYPIMPDTVRDLPETALSTGPNITGPTKHIRMLGEGLLEINGEQTGYLHVEVRDLRGNLLQEILETGGTGSSSVFNIADMVGGNVGVVILLIDNGVSREIVKMPVTRH